jgi:hypothetical protein
MKIKAFLWVALAATATLLLVSTVVFAGPRSVQLPPEKQAIEDKITALRQGNIPAQKLGRAGAPADGTSIQGPQPIIGGVPAGAGTLFNGDDMMRPPGYPDDAFTNSWSIVSSTTNVDVWAGARGADPDQGFLVVAVWNPDRTTVLGGGEYNAPARGGALQITGNKGSTISLTDAKGASLVFDYVELAFR